MAVDSSIQRISRLTPLSTVLALIESRVGAVKPEKRAPEPAGGRMLAEDVVATERPPQAVALRDGYAVVADTIGDAGPYSPIAFASMPRRVDVGEPLPRGTDAVLPLDAVMLRGGRAEATAMVAIGEGVLSAGDDATPRTPLRRAGERLRTLDVAAIAAAGINDVTIREPRIGLARAGGVNTPPIDAAYALVARAVTADGAALNEAPGLEAALADQRADAIIAVGGTGNGRNDSSVRMLAELGRVEAHGIAVAPGETAAFGFVGERPVLLVPGRLDCALTVWLLIGRYLVARLAGGEIKDLPALIPLKRKVTSTIGMTELVPVHFAGGMAEPLGCGYLSVTALTRSDGWIVVAAESEGFAAGTQVAVRPWP
jgi:molybdopterin biosynthesis enzyme